AKTLFPDAALDLYPNFDMVFDALKKTNGVALVPLENSLHGSVDEVLDLILETDTHVWRTDEISVRQAIGALDRTKVKRVASHSQALSQCREYLRKEFLTAERFPTSSTVMAIDLALKDPSIAAIGSPQTMKERGLPILAEDIQSRTSNTTRFAVVAKEDPFPGSPKTQMSVVLHLKKDDRPGLLHAMLTPFKVYDVNITRIENRPTGERLGDYLFFLDFFGNRESPRVQKVLDEIREYADIRFLGEW
ncbi:MAG: prephenate dehydratase, partial [Candidatus Peribacteraceae bacterium]|nr:prephenate dehydratase [Candidatus Peribacteraceae bacterium]